MFNLFKAASPKLKENRIVAKTALDALSKAGVFGVAKHPDGRYCLYDGCEGYSQMMMTREQLRELARELTALAEDVTND